MYSIIINNYIPVTGCAVVVVVVVVVVEVVFNWADSASGSSVVVMGDVSDRQQ